MRPERDDNSFLAWPGRDLRRTLPMSLAFMALFAVTFVSTSWLASLHATLPAWDLAFETQLPFVPSLSLVYLTITPMMLLAPFIFRSRSELWPLFASLCLQTVIAACFFLLLPQTTKFVRPAVIGWIRLPFLAADTMSMDYNQFPSLHVAFAWTAAWSYGTRTRATGRIVLATWALVVTASTWLIWEHNLIDIIGGLLLAAIVLGLVYPRLKKPSSKEVVWIELCCLHQCLQFSRRHLRYFVIFLTIYVPSLRHWRRYRVVRVAFSTAQWIDDLLDGDRACDVEPNDVIEALVGEMQTCVFSTQPLSRLTRALFRELDAFRTESRDPHADFIALVETMQRDRERVRGAEVWTQQELDEHQRRTFRLSIDLMLRITGCTARADQLPDLIAALAWCSTFRDLDHDLRKGLINIPGEVWRADASSSRAQLAETPAFRAWTRAQYDRALAALSRSDLAIAQLDDPRSRSILGIFQSSVRKFARRFSRESFRHPST